MNMEQILQRAQALHARVRALQQTADASPLADNIAALASDLAAMTNDLQTVAWHHQVNEVQHFHAQLLDLVEQAIMVTDLFGTVVYRNTFAQQLYDWSIHHSAQLSIRSIIASENDPRQVATMLCHLYQGQRWLGELHARRSDGTIAPVQMLLMPITKDDGALVGTVSVSFDISASKQAEALLYHAQAELERRVRERTVDLEKTNITLRHEINERQRAEKALHASQHFIERITETTPAILYVYDLIEHRSVYTNRGFETILGYSPEILQTTDLQMGFQLVHPDDRERVDDMLHRLTLVADGEIVASEYRIQDANDAWRWLYSRNTVFMRNALGKTQQIIGAIIDITERKQAEEALRQAQADLEQRVIKRTAELADTNMVLRWEIDDRIRAEEQLRASLREKEVLLQEIHHRVKNNLQVISSLLDLQSEQITDPATLAAFCESQNRVRTMAIIHEKLYQSPDLGQINFGQYIQELTDYLFRSYAADITQIDCDITVEDVFLGVDTAIPCGLIVNELLSNALKYAFPLGQHGRITIGFHAEPDGRLILSVSDTGIGIPAEFDLQTTESLGLQLVHMLVRQLNGTLTLNRNHGTAFTITFFRPESPPPAAV